ncbi:hypothetical protein GLOIN_2v1489479 [Rhizophagus clarus]|uniref:Uncharacterized protein n=1 Tax=Rhizophagus clarus TaxID=94130 RepID=A0A8H3LZQ9_9GLOM|nr:hypothetical protein GLOIN_2v1489479 [Rhizophagus clarus]
MSTQIQLTDIKPISQEIEQALINVVKAGIYYRRPKDGKFMQSYKERIKKLRQVEDPEELAKDYFVTEDKIDEEAEDFLNS